MEEEKEGEVFQIFLWRLPSDPATSVFSLRVKRDMSALTYTVSSISKDSLPACIYFRYEFLLLLLLLPRRERQQRQTVAILRKK